MLQSTFFPSSGQFARTLRTEINPLWCKKAIRRLSSTFSLDLLSLGEDEFRERLRAPFEFESRQVQEKLQRLVGLATRLNRRDHLANILIALQAHYPIYLSVRKEQR